jgi:hypothetical protein
VAAPIASNAAAMCRRSAVPFIGNLPLGLFFQRRRVARSCANATTKKKGSGLSKALPQTRRGMKLRAPRS